MITWHALRKPYLWANSDAPLEVSVWLKTLTDVQRQEIAADICLAREVGKSRFEVYMGPAGGFGILVIHLDTTTNEDVTISEDEFISLMAAESKKLRNDK